MENNNSWIIPINLTELAPTVAITLIIAILFYLSRNEISGLFNKFFEFKSKNYELQINELQKDIEFLKNENLELKKELELIKKDYKELLNNYQGLLASIAKQDQHLTEIDNKIS